MIRLSAEGTILYPARDVRVLCRTYGARFYPLLSPGSPGANFWSRLRRLRRRELNFVAMGH